MKYDTLRQKVYYSIYLNDPTQTFVSSKAYRNNFVKAPFDIKRIPF